MSGLRRFFDCRTQPFHKANQLSAVADVLYVNTRFDED